MCYNTYMKYKYLLLLVIIALSTLLSGFFVFRTQAATSDDIQVLNKEIADRKDKIKQLEDTIEKYKQNITQKQTEAVSLKNQLSILDNRVAQIQTDIDLTQEKIKEAELQIEALQLSIKEKQAVIARQKKIIADMVQNIHASDQKNYLEIALTYDNFADFYNELKYTENVYVDLGRSVRTLRIASEELQAKQAQVDNKRKTYENLKKELEGKKGELTEQTFVKERLLLETRSSESRYQTLLSSLKQQYQVIEGEVRAYEEKVSKKLEEQDKIQATGSVVFSWPVPSRYITTLFHDPDYPFRKVFEHSGLDIRASHGTPIKAAASGYVARARRCTSSACYSYVLIVHTGNLSTLYGHMSSIIITDDQFVNRGDVIGYSGGTPGTVGAGPFVTGPHLHFEVRQNGIPVDPMPYMAQ